MSRKSLLKYTRANGTSRVVGDFFEDLARKLLRGESCEPEHGDLVYWGMPSFVGEVKASDNCHPFRIPKAQFDWQAENLGFLYPDQVFILCKYNNKQGRRKGQMRRSIIKRLRSKEKIAAYLAQGKVRVHILHRCVIEALVQRFYPQGELPLGLDEAECIEIYHRTLEKFCHPTKSHLWLKELELKGMKICSFSIKLPLGSGFIGFETHVTVTTVLPSVFSKKMHEAFFLPRVEQRKVAVAA